MGTPGDVIQSPSLVDEFPICMSKALRPHRETAKELHSSFHQRLVDYNGALNDSGAESDRSEEALIEIIRKIRMTRITSPKDYQELVQLQAFEPMVGLLGNCGKILASRILLAFEKLTYGNIYLMDDEQAANFVNLLVKYQAVEPIVSCFLRISKNDNVVYEALQTIAHMIFIRPDVAEIVGKQTKLINWILEVLKTKGCDYKKQYTAGLLTTILQYTSMENILKLGEMGTVKVVVEALLPYTESDMLDQELLDRVQIVCQCLPNAKIPIKKEDMLDQDEVFDLVQSLFDCLFCLLSPVENKQRFAEAGGVHLMLQIVKQEKLSNFYYGSAIQALHIALEKCPAASDKFVNDALALDIAFPASMDAISSSITHKRDEIEGHLMSLIAKLTDGATGVKKDTLLDKFMENDCKIIAWLLDLFTRYSEKVNTRIKQLKDEQLNQSELYAEKLEYGLSTLQSIAVILAHLWLSKRRTIRAKIEELKKYVLVILNEYRDNIGNEDKPEEVAAKTVINECIASLEKEANSNSQGVPTKKKKKKTTLTGGGSRR